MAGPFTIALGNSAKLMKKEDREAEEKTPRTRQVVRGGGLVQYTATRAVSERVSVKKELGAC